MCGESEQAKELAWKIDFSAAQWFFFLDIPDGQKESD